VCMYIYRYVYIWVYIDSMGQTPLPVWGGYD
jgi:hypothetical protein